MAALIKKDFMLLKKYVLFIIVIVFALPADTAYLISAFARIFVIFRTFKPPKSIAQYFPLNS